jgi:trigger factor
VPQGLGVRVPSSALSISLPGTIQTVIILDITRQQTGALTAEIHLHLDSQDYKPDVDTKLKETARSAAMPGFRRGKTPVAIIRKMAGKSLVAEVLNEKVNHLIDEYIREQELPIVGSPLPKTIKSEADFDPNCETPMDFIFEVGLAPEFELNYNLPGLPPLYTVTVDQAFLDQEISRLRKYYGPYERPEIVEKGDSVFGFLAEVNEEGLNVEGGFRKAIGMREPENVDERIWPDFVGKTKGDRIPFDQFIPAENTEAWFAHNFYLSLAPGETLEGKKIVWEIESIGRIQLADIDAAFIGSASQEYNFALSEEATYEELLDAMRAHFEKVLSEDARRHVESEIYTLMIDSHPLELPEEFLKRWMTVRGEETKTADEADKEYPALSRSLIWNLITDKVQKDYPEMKVSGDEVTARALTNLRAAMRRYGQELSPEEEQNYLQSYLRDNNRAMNDYYNLLYDKVIRLIFERQTLAKTPISASEFVKVMEEKKNAPVGTV